MKIKEAFNVGENHGKLWFMSDLHYNHANVIKFNNRPFNSVEEMNTYIETELIEKVGPNDIIFDMGDLFWKTDEDSMKQVIKSASPKEWYKILGNHDNWNVYKVSDIGKMFTLISDLLEINVNYQGKNYKLVLCHYPMVSWRDKSRGSLMISGHCVDEETEILTLDGWKKHNEINLGDKIYSYNPETEKLEETTIDYIIKYEDYVGDYYLFECSHMSMCVTDDHIVTRLSNYDESGKYSYLEDLAKNIFTKNKGGIRLIRSFELSKPNKGIDLTDDEIRLYITLAADGSIVNSSLGRLRFKKLRKVEYVEQLLGRLNLKYHKSYVADDMINISFTVPDKILKNWRIKGLDKKLLNVNRDQCWVILDTYANTDGTRVGDSFSIYTSKLEEVELLQQVLLINGFAARKYTRYGHGFSKQESYELHVGNYKHKLSGFKSQNGDSYVNKITCNGDKLFWCIKTKNQNFICRRKGFAYLTGNCHGNIDTFNDESPDLRVDVGFDGGLAKKVGSFLISFEDIFEHMKKKSGGEDFMKYVQAKCKEL